MNLRRIIAGGFAAGALLVAHAAFAQATNANTVGVWGQDSGTGLPCRIAPVGGSNTCVLPSGLVATGTFNDAAVGTVSDPTPAFAGTTGISVGGNLQVPTGANPSGSIYATQTDIASIAGATVKTGNGTALGAFRVVIGSDNTPFHIIVDSAPTTAVTGTFWQATQPISAASLPLPAGAATAANQATANTSLATIAAANSYAHIATSTTTLVKSGAGTLHTVCVNTLGTVASAATVDDALTATTPTIAVIDTLTGGAVCRIYDVNFATGLTIVTTGAPDITVSYR